MLDYTPIAPPALPVHFKPDTTLTADQEQLYKQVLAHFSKPEYTIPGLENGELTETEKFWLSHECLLRYLRATKWLEKTAIQRLEETLKWRREFGLYDLITADYIEPEAVTGKEIIFGYDTSRRPASYMIPSRQNTDESPRQVQFAVWMLERAIDVMGPGVECIDLLINFADKAKNPSFSQSKEVLNIIQSHYPERLGLAIAINVPWLIHIFFKMIGPFIDPVTRTKLKFNPELIKDGTFTPDMIMKQWWGGDREFEYDHEKYWPALVQMCNQRVKEQMERWRELGGTVGLKEWDVKGGQSVVENGNAEQTVEETKEDGA
jgi:hypothetical protein